MQVIGPFKMDEIFIQEDFNLLDKYTMKTSADKIKSKVKAMNLDDRQYVQLQWNYMKSDTLLLVYLKFLCTF